MSLLLAGCGGPASVATFTHDLGGTPTLHAYPAEPASETRGGERLANRVYGMNTRSPKTPYVCVWRDADPTRFRAAAGAGPPHKILLFCHFGTDAWSPPSNLVEQAEAAMRRDEATVVMGWDRHDGSYRMSRFEVTISNLAAGRNFSSRWFGGEAAGLAFSRMEVAFPKSPVEPVTFAVRATLPQRLNKGDGPGKATATFAIEGSAAPIPPWMNY